MEAEPEMPPDRIGMQALDDAMNLRYYKPKRVSPIMYFYACVYLHDLVSVVINQLHRRINCTLVS